MTDLKQMSVEELSDLHETAAAYGGQEAHDRAVACFDELARRLSECQEKFNALDTP